MCLFKILFLSVQDHQEFHNVQDSVMKKSLMKLPFKSIYQLYFIQSFLIAIHGATPSLASNLLQRYILQNSSNVAQAQIKFFKLPLAIDSTFRFLAFSYGVILFFLNYFSILSTLHTTHDEGIGLVAEVLRNTVWKMTAPWFFWNVLWRHSGIFYSPFWFLYSSHSFGKMDSSIFIRFVGWHAKYMENV